MSKIKYIKPNFFSICEEFNELDTCVDKRQHCPDCHYDKKCKKYTGEDEK